MLDNSFWLELTDLIANAEPAWVATIIQALGSSPAQPGMKMLIGSKGLLAGTIGGGELELSVINRTVKQQPVALQLWDFEFDMDNEHGMICGGSAQVLVEPLNAQPRLYIFGGGHCGMALSELASRCGFAVTVYDDRSEWANAHKHPQARHFICRGYDQVATAVTAPGQAYAVIMTHGHSADEQVLGLLAPLGFKWLGMMGSNQKVKQVFANLTAAGISPDILQHVHAPVGMPIGSHTPWEIAVSICAQLIEFRNTHP